ncbi:MAG TPA: cation transporter [Bacteroidales bacterium]|nr:cation transporter [Bacteroidales bacterium]
MNRIKVLFTAILTIALFSSMVQANPTAPGNKTETIKVSGNCGSCKTKIEKAAKIEGVSEATWNTDTKVLTVVYDPSKVTSDDIQKKIAAVGYDTEKYKADEKAYNYLPGCCQYDRKN